MVGKTGSHGQGAGVEPGLERQLMRLIHGELPPEDARRLQQRLEVEPELAAAHRRLQALWQGLELPPPSPVPVGFRTRVLARLAAERDPKVISWALAPGWVRATAALVLVLGVVLGASLGTGFMADTATGGWGLDDLDRAAGSLWLDSSAAEERAE